MKNFFKELFWLIIGLILISMIFSTPRFDADAATGAIPGIVGEAAMDFIRQFKVDIALIGEAQDPDKWQGITNLATRIRDRIDTMEEMSRDRLD